MPPPGAYEAQGQDFPCRNRLADRMDFITRAMLDRTRLRLRRLIAGGSGGTSDVRRGGPATGLPDPDRSARLSQAELIVQLAERERRHSRDRSRLPEPMVYDDPRSVRAFDQAGAEGGPMLPLYEASARSVSRLLPQHGLVLELGCGSGRWAIHLALRRPDAMILGVDLAEPMLTAGRSLLDEQGLRDRVELRRGDMTAIHDLGSITPAVVVACLSLHHLPGAAALHRCLTGIAAMSRQSGCAVWLFDLARLRNPQTYHDLLASNPAISGQLLKDALASEAAAWTIDEMKQALTSADLACTSRSLSPLPFIQSHWTAGTLHPEAGAGDGWIPRALPAWAEREAAGIDHRIGVKL